MKKILSLIFALSIILSSVFALTSFAADDEISKDGWTIKATSQIQAIERAIDGDIDTIWHSGYTAEGGQVTAKDPMPYTVTLTLPEETEVSGFRYYPRLGGSVAGTFYDIIVYISEDGENYTEMGQVKFQYNPAYSDREGGKTVDFTANVKIKSLKFDVIKGYSDFGTMAELSLLKKKDSLSSADAKSVKLAKTVIPATENGVETQNIAKETGSAAVGGAGADSGKVKDEITDKSGWTVSASSIAQKAENAIDGNIDTIWHSGYKAEGSTITEKDPMPYTFELTLPDVTEISGIRYYPRLGGSTAGVVKGMGIEISEDGSTYTKLGDVKLSYNPSFSDREVGRTIKFDSNVGVKSVRLTITKGQQDFGTMSELSLLKSDEKLKAAEVTAVKLTATEIDATTGIGGASASGKKEEAKEETKPIEAAKSEYEEDEMTPGADWKVTASSAMTKPELAIDGSLATFWHSAYVVEDGKIVFHDMNPFDYIITFPEETEVSGIRYYPRDESQSSAGIFKIVSLYVSDDGENFYPAVEDFTFSYGGTTTKDQRRTPCELVMSRNVKAKAIKLVIVDSMSNYAVASEIRVLKPTLYKETVTVAEMRDNYGDYKMLPIDRSEVKVEASSEQPYPFENANDMHSTAIKTIDRNEYSVWHTQYRNEDGSTEGFNKKVMPAYLEYDLGKEYTLSGFGFMPRGQGFLSGHWVEFEISTSADGENYDFVDSYVLNPTQYKSFNFMRIPFYEPITTRYFRIDILVTTNDGGSKASAHATCADVQFYESEKDQLARLSGEKECYTLHIGSKDIRVTKGEEGRVKTIDVEPFIVEGTTMIPLRGLFEEMGAEVTWHGENKKITVEAEGTAIEFQIENNRVWVNGIRYTSPVAPRIENGRTFIPLRFVSERLGYTVGWDGATQTITIEK
ncbi:MAG: discoidin domain-containing protein [Clostridia bacterium]|nr:discoidin domain-containing protein [Clostridia bacterium]